jgi:putative membrane protein
VFFLAGAVAVSAWLLPAVSGSFVLLTIGLYEAVIGALVAPHWDILLVFLSGCAVGLLLFSRALSMLLRRWRDPLLAFLTGFMAGASLQLWPWQAEGEWLGAAGYAAQTGDSALVAATVVAMLCGGLTIWLLSRFES